MKKTRNDVKIDVYPTDQNEDKLRVEVNTNQNVMMTGRYSQRK